MTKAHIVCSHCRGEFDIYVQNDIASLKINCIHCGESLYPQLYDFEGMEFHQSSFHKEVQNVSILFKKRIDTFL